MKFADELLGNKSERAGFIWNIIGSTVYATVSMLLGTAVVRTLGADKGGIFLFAFSTMGQHIFTVAYFGMRSVHVTDTRKEHSFGDYLRFRKYTCIAAFIIAALAAVLYAGFNFKGLIIVIVSVYRILDGLADCFESEFQRDGRLDRTGKSLTFRTLISITAFMAVMVISKDLTAACAAADIGLAVSITVFCLIPVRKMDCVSFSVREDSAKELFSQNVWLFAAVFLDYCMISASRYAIDYSQPARISGYYSLLFIPTSIMSLMSGFLIRPQLTRLSEKYYRRDIKGLNSILLKITGVIAVLTVIAVAGAYLFGIPVLGIFAGESAMKEMMEYRTSLAILVLGGGFYALCYLLYYLLVIFKKQKTLFLCYAVLTGFAVVISFVMARLGGIRLAAAAYLITTILISAAFWVVTIREEKKL